MNNTSDNKAYFLKDTALISKDNDEFHHEDYVKNLKKIILEHAPPYNIALIGKWGVGKSSIINLLKEELRGRPEIRTHEINAWKYENDSLKKAFLKNLYKEFNPDVDSAASTKWGEDFRKGFGGVNHETTTLSPVDALKNIFPILKTLLTLWIIASILVLLVLYAVDGINVLFTDNTFGNNAQNTFSDFRENIWVPIIIGPLLLMLQVLVQAAVQRKSADVHFIKPIETADEYEELFKKEIASYKKKNPAFKKLVVIVDDLDRLTTKKVVAALDAIKAFVEINECIFIVTCDDNILINALEKEKLNKSLDVDGELFLDKLFHFRVSLPPIIERDMSDFAIKIAKQEAPGLVEACNGLFQELTDILIHTEVSTPRQVKKIMNTFANNLLIARARESDGRKLEDKLLTNDQGLRYLAKISVIQSDYNEVYGELVKDYNYLEELLYFYQNDQDRDEKTKSSIKKFFNSKNNDYQIKQDFEGLVNFLTRNEHITVDNIAPFIYLGQDVIGLNAGDEKQRMILQSLTNGNEKPVLEILKATSENVYITQAIIEVIKQAPIKDISSVIKAAVPLINSVDEKKREFANIISYRLNTINLSQIRFWQLLLPDMLKIYFSSDNQTGIERAILRMLEELFTKNKKWKNALGKEFSTEEFTTKITQCLENLFDVEQRLPSSIKQEMKSFLNDSNEEYNFYSFDSIHKIYLKYPQHFENYFGLPFYMQLISDIESSDNEQHALEMKTFYEIAPKIRTLDSESFIQSISTVIKAGGTEYLLDTLELLNPTTDEIEEDVGASIVESVTHITVNEEQVNDISNTLLKIPFNLNSIEGLTDQFDNFIVDLLSDEEIGGKEELLNLMDYGMQQSESSFDIYENTYEYVFENFLETSSFDKFIAMFNGSFTDEQRKRLFDKLKALVTLNAYNTITMERVYILYSILINEEENIPYIEETMKLGIQEFRNNKWNQNKNWANDFINLFAITSSIVDQTDIKNLLVVLEGVVTQAGHTDMTIKALKNFGNYLPEDRIVSLRSYSINNSTTDSSKMDALDFLNSTRKYMNKENGNLTEYATFLINNFTLNIERFLEVLTSSFSFLSIESMVRLLINTSKLEADVLNAKLPLIQATVEKFFMKYNDKQKEQVLFSAIKEEVEELTIDNVLLEALDSPNRTNLLNKALNSEDAREKDVRMVLLKLCEPSQNSIDNLEFTNLLIDMFKEDDEDYINKTSNLLLHQFTNYRFNKEKRRISEQIFSTFRNVNLSTKRKLLEVSKVFLLRDIFVENIKQNVFTEEEEKLIIEIFKIRTRKKGILRRN
ncbi:KAP family P-loop NTPase fold protein [Planococcus shixiaomingii]|uniref:KAP family P-loop NTPase fold protein n=1 Tax=Planococcus shixiaomingii TaxID=3058393 RepID=UPI00260E423B|nr:P-loop NTPase fold protein [Planococcus sp. N022]WKA55359.1 P-loop NTPase fold protein [Planococcus sp. N022]